MHAVISINALQFHKMAEIVGFSVTSGHHIEEFYQPYSVKVAPIKPQLTKNAAEHNVKLFLDKLKSFVAPLIPQDTIVHEYLNLYKQAFLQNFDQE